MTDSFEYLFIIWESVSFSERSVLHGATLIFYSFSLQFFLKFKRVFCICISDLVVLLVLKRRSQWPRGLRRRSAATRLLRLWVRIPPGEWMFVCCKCCVLSGRGLCDELVSRPEESYRLWCVVVCDLVTSWMRRPWPALGRSATGGGEQKTKKKPRWNWWQSRQSFCETQRTFTI